VAVDEATAVTKVFVARDETPEPDGRVGIVEFGGAVVRRM
jgi:hypothetical protein